MPNLVRPAQLPGALALTFGLTQLTMVVGPALGGLLIALAEAEALAELSGETQTWAAAAMSDEGAASPNVSASSA